MYHAMQQHEKQSVTKLVKELLRRDLTLVISDEETTEPPTTDSATAMDALGNSDLNRIRAYDAQMNYKGGFLLIYGNCKGEMISDCSDNMFCECVCAAIGEPI